MLVAEDEAMLRQLTCELLRTNGYAVLEARDPAEAIEISKQTQKPIHLLMTDLVMQGMNGRMLAERLQSERPEMKVLYMSGYTDDIAFRNGLLDIDTSFLRKPFTMNALMHKLRAVLG